MPDRTTTGAPGGASKTDAATLFYGLVLVLTVILPSMIRMQGLASSMALGVFVVALGHIYLALALPWKGAPWPGIGQGLAAALAAIMIVLTAGGIGLLLYAGVDAGRLLGSTLFAVLFMAGSLAMARSAHAISEASFDHAVRMTFFVLVFSGICGALHISPFTTAYVKAVLFFTEPSHYALSFLPFLMYMSITADLKRKIIFIAIGLAIGAVIQNLSLIVGIMIISVIVLKVRHILMLSPLVLVAVLFVSLEYYASRLDFSKDSSNFSALVFLGGWERAYLAFRDTYGVGLGFQQFGILGDQGTFAKIIVKLLGDELNVLDGGTVGAKFIGEFGMLGLILVLIYIYSAFRIYLQLKARPTDQFDRRFLFAACCLIMFSVDIFVRGVGYFSPSAQLFAAGLVWLAAEKEANRSPALVGERS